VSRDCDRTLIHYESFKDAKSAEAALSNLLNAYAVHDPEVGYCQGMNFLAAFVLTKLDEEDAYWALYALLNGRRYAFRNFFLPDLRGMLMCKHHFTQLLMAFLPRLSAHFAVNGVPADVHTEWFMTLFTFRHMPRETAARIWDLIFVDGQKTIYRVALAILFLCEDELLQMDFEGIFHYVRTLPDKTILEPSRLIRTALTFKVTNSLLEKMSAQYARARAT
jgi:hypothetical protein